MMDEASHPTAPTPHRLATVPPVPKQTRGPRVVVNFRVSSAVKARAVAICEREDVNLSDVLRDLLEQWVEEHDDQ